VSFSLYAHTSIHTHTHTEREREREREKETERQREKEHIQTNNKLTETDKRIYRQTKHSDTAKQPYLRLSVSDRCNAIRDVVSD